MDFSALRTLLRQHIGAITAYTHRELPDFFARMGLPPPPEEAVSKHQRLVGSFDQVRDADLPTIAERFLRERPPAAAARNELQDAVWATRSYPTISKRCRREVARAIGADFYLEAPAFDVLVDSLWVLETEAEAAVAMFGGDSSGELRNQIERYVHRNPGDWDAETLFGQLGAFTASDRRFALFLEGLASSEVRPDVEEQRRFVDAVNVPLRDCQVELRETGEDGGYPVFMLVPLSTRPLGRPKNLIFASAVKPDLRFRDAVDNDVEVVTDADKVLIYDRPVGSEGLRWSELQAWWSETQGIGDAEEAKRSLYRRLQSSLPAESPPQQLLFDAYHRAFGAAVPDLPALLPEVWLHWDPRTVAQRGKDALLRFRMDFLLLFPFGVRIVVEVDGQQHYADKNGKAEPGRYGSMMAADRELRLAGYEVFRFGASELVGDAGEKLVRDFFTALFQRYGVVVPAK